LLVGIHVPPSSLFSLLQDEQNLRDWLVDSAVADIVVVVVVVVVIVFYSLSNKTPF
jgi:hypothetical protein